MSPLASEPVVALDMRTNLYIGRDEIARRFVDLMLGFNNIFVPQKFDIEKKKDQPNKIPFIENVERAITEMSSGEFPGLVAERKKPVHVSYGWYPTNFTMFDQVSIMVGESWFREASHLSKTIQFAKRLYSIVEASSGHVCHWDLEPRYDRVEERTEEGGIRNRPRFPGVHHNLSGLYWANFFGPEYVEMWSRDFLLGAPCYGVEDLDDGGMLLYLADSPLRAKEESYSVAKERLFAYLGLDAFDGRRYPRFRTEGPWRKKRDARPRVETGGILDDVFSTQSP